MLPATTSSTPAWLRESQTDPSSSSLSKTGAKSKNTKNASVEQWQALGMLAFEPAQSAFPLTD
jgi:hypothetical protein